MDPHDIGSFLRGFLGFPGGVHNRGRRGEEDEEPDGSAGQYPGEVTRPLDPFSVLTDPLQMHRFFEQQMDEMVRSFGGSAFRGMGLAMPGEDRDGLLPEVETPDSQGAKRDFMLREDASSSHPRRDVDLDEKQVDTGDLDKLFGRRNNLESGHLYEPRGGVVDLFPGFGRQENLGESNRSGSWSKVMSQKTVIRGNGERESTTTIRNSDGSQTVTVTRQMGDQQTEETRQFRPDGTEMVGDHGRKEEEGLRRDMLAPPPADRLSGLLWDKFFGK